ncbi:SUMO protein smt3 [Clarireedia jacksonii]
MSDNEGSPAGEKPETPVASEHLNIKVTDNNNEVFFKIKRSTQLKKLMDAFCDRQGKAPNSVRFLFDGSRVQPTDSPDKVRCFCFACSCCLLGGEQAIAPLCRIHIH